MWSINIQITINGRAFSWPEGLDGIQPDETVMAENYVRFVLKALELRGAEDDLETDQARRQAKRPRKTNRAEHPKETRDSIGHHIAKTADEIRSSGPSLINWLQSAPQGPRRKARLDGRLSQYLQDMVRGTMNPSRMERAEWKYSSQSTFIALVYMHGGLTMALLAVCAFSSSALARHSFEELVSLVEFIVRNREALSSDALETVAKGLPDMINSLLRTVYLSWVDFCAARLPSNINFPPSEPLNLGTHSATSLDAPPGIGFETTETDCERFCTPSK